MGAMVTIEKLISQGRGYSLKKPGIKVSSIFLKSITANPHKTDLSLLEKKAVNLLSTLKSNKKTVNNANCPV